MTVTILQADVRAALARLPADHFDCVVTSPPYWGLRDYGVAGQIGLEPTLGEHLAVMVDVFALVRRVLKPSGTLWLNLGDSYWTAKGASQGVDPKQGARRGWVRPQDGPAPVGLKGKDLIGIPWRVAFALQEDGWYLRQDIIWHKPNSMPESVRDRCTKAHEYVFMLSKGPRYHYDHEAIKEPAVSDHASGNEFKREARESYKNADGVSRGNDQQWQDVGGTRNCRSVWTVNTKPFKGAHFATFPPELVERCLDAGCPPNGRVLDPFGGAGTTGLVADGLGLDCTLIEISPDYAELARRRIAGAAGMFADVRIEADLGTEAAE